MYSVSSGTLIIIIASIIGIIILKIKIKRRKERRSGQRNAKTT